MSAFGVFSLRASWPDVFGVVHEAEWLVYRPQDCGLEDWHAWVESFLLREVGPRRCGWSLARPGVRELERATIVEARSRFA